SIAGFAFSALCGALLFHLLESPVYTVQVMLVCSIAIQLFSVSALWRTIDWRSLPVFLIVGIFGVPAGVSLLLHLPSGPYRQVLTGTASPFCYGPLVAGAPSARRAPSRSGPGGGAARARGSSAG